MNILIEKNVMVPMRDGVMLATDVYRPAEGGPVPVLLSHYHWSLLDLSPSMLRGDWCLFEDKRCSAHQPNMIS
jgi:predicted acyl esterase